MAKVQEPRSTQKKKAAAELRDSRSTKKCPAVLKGHWIGYVRVSTVDQNAARQLEGVVVERTFTDKASGKDVKRPQLEAMLAFAREGDTIVCHSMDRMARNLDDLRRIVLGLTQRGIHVRFLKESLTFTGEDSPMANLLLSVMGAFAQFERELIKERQREGIAIAKKAGVYKGRKPSLTMEKAEHLRHRLALGEKRTAIARDLGISRFTTYEYAPVASIEKSISSARRGTTILCVEQNEQILSMRRFMLETRDYVVKTALNDEAGINALRRGGVDLVFSSCIGVIREAKALDPSLPAIYLAGEMNPQCAEADLTLKTGSQSPVEILASIRNVINHSKIGRLNKP